MSIFIPFSTDRSIVSKERACKDCVSRGVPAWAPCTHVILRGSECTAQPKWADFTMIVGGMSYEIFSMPEVQLVQEESARPSVLLNNVPSVGKTYFIDVHKAVVKWPKSKIFLDAWWDVAAGIMRVSMHNLEYPISKAEFNQAWSARAFLNDFIPRIGRSPRDQSDADEFRKDCIRYIRHKHMLGLPITEATVGEEMGRSRRAMIENLNYFNFDWDALVREGRRSAP